MNFIPRREGNRKPVVASRISKIAGGPWPERTSNWDTPTDTVGSPSNRELMDRKKPRMPKGSEPVKSTTSNYEERKAPKGNEYRSKGDD